MELVYKGEKGENGSMLDALGMDAILPDEKARQQGQYIAVRCSI